MKTSSPLRLIFLLVFIWALLIIRLGSPWYGVQEAARVWVHAGVQSYDRYGLDVTNGMVIRDLGPATPPNFDYYVHHPPTVIWLPYAFTRVAGDNELSIRWVSIAATMIAVSAFYVLVRRLYGDKVAWWATAFYGLVPMMAYYGRVPSHDILAMTVVLLFAAIMINWLRQPSRRRLLALIGLAWLAVWTAWTGVFFVAFLGFAAMAVGRMGHRVAVIGLGVTCIVAFVVLIAFYQSQWSGAVDSLIEVFGWRASNLSDDRASDPFTVWEFIFVTLLHIGLFITIGVTLISMWGARILRRRSSNQAFALVLALFGGALVYQLVFRNASYVHDYYKLTFLPAMAITAALAWVYVRPSRKWTRPVFDGLLLISIITGGAWLFWLHTTGDRPAISAIVEVIDTETTTDDIIITNMIGRDLVWPIAFYTFRNIEQNETYTAALARAETTAQRVVYIYCAGAEQGVLSKIDDEAAQVISADVCQVVFID